MSSSRLSTSRFIPPQTTVEWEQKTARFFAVLAKVPVQRWQFLVRLLLVVCLSICLAQLFWLVFPKPSIPVAVVALPKMTTQVVKVDQSINIAQLKSLAVFGRADIKPNAGNPENQAVDTHLNLTLLGVIISSDEKAGRAIISMGDKADIYAVDASLPVGNSVTLSKVMADRAIVNNNGQFETLWLYLNDPGKSSIAQAAIVNAGPAAWSPPRDEPLPDVNNGGIPNGDPAVTQAARSLSDVVAMSVYRENGQVAGYRIRPGRDVEKFRSLGLQADDIVTSINGMPLTNPAKIMEMYKNMGNTTSASLEIKRGGTLMKIDVVL